MPGVARCPDRSARGQPPNSGHRYPARKSRAKKKYGHSGQPGRSGHDLCNFLSAFPGGASKSRFGGQFGAMANLDLPGRQIWGHVLGLVRSKGGHPLTGARFRTLSTNIMHDYTGLVIGREERDVISFGNCCGLAPVRELHASRCPFLVRLSNVFFHTSHPTQRSTSSLNSQHISKVLHRGASAAPSSVKPALFC